MTLYVYNVLLSHERSQLRGVAGLRLSKCLITWIYSNVEYLAEFKTCHFNAFDFFHHVCYLFSTFNQLGCLCFDYLVKQLKYRL